MEKRTKNIRYVAAMAMLTAISIVLGKYLGINVGEFMRFSLENMPIIFAGVALGPISGVIVGVVADLIGCLMMGWVPIPWVTVGAAVIGAVSGVLPSLLQKTKLNPVLVTAITVALAHLFGSVLVKTIGLSAFQGIPYYILLLWRTLNYLIIGTLDGIILHILLMSKGISMQIKELGGREK